MTSKQSLQTLLLLLGVLVIGARIAVAQGAAQIDVQYERKADMLCPLSSLLLPASAFGRDGTFRIGVLGGDPFDGRDQFGNAVNHLDQMVADKRNVYKGKRIVVQRFISVKDYQPCHVLFIADRPAPDSAEKTAQQRLAAVIEKIGGAPVLLIGDSPGLAEKGAHINFFVSPNPAGVPVVKFEFNSDAATRNGLTVDAGLLRLAAKIFP